MLKATRDKGASIAVSLMIVLNVLPFTTAYAEWGSGDSQILSDIYIELTSWSSGMLQWIYYDVDAIMYQLTSDYADGSDTVRGVLKSIDNQLANGYNINSVLDTGSGKLGNYLNTISGNITTIATNSDNIKNYTTVLNNIKTGVDSISSSMTTNSANITSIKTNTDTVTTTLNTVSSNITNLSNAFQKQKYSNFNNTTISTSTEYTPAQWLVWLYKEQSKLSTLSTQFNSLKLSDYATISNSTLYTPAQWIVWLYKGVTGTNEQLKSVRWADFSSATIANTTNYTPSQWLVWIYKEQNKLSGLPNQFSSLRWADYDNETIGSTTNYTPAQWLVWLYREQQKLSSLPTQFNSARWADYDTETINSTTLYTPTQWLAWIYRNTVHNPEIKKQLDSVTGNSVTYSATSLYTPSQWLALIYKKIPGSSSGGGGSSADLTTIEGILNNLTFLGDGAAGHVLKVYDAGNYETLGDIYTQVSNVNTNVSGIRNDVNGIKNLLIAWYSADTADDAIEHFDYDLFETRTDGLLSTISSLAPFGSVLLISECVAILTQVNDLDDPSFTFAFDFFEGHHYNVNVDLSWCDDLKPTINFFCMLLLVMGLASVTLDFVKLEASA